MRFIILLANFKKIILLITSVCPSETETQREVQTHRPELVCSHKQRKGFNRKRGDAYLHHLGLLGCCICMRLYRLLETILFVSSSHDYRWDVVTTSEKEHMFGRFVSFADFFSFLKTPSDLHRFMKTAKQVMALEMSPVIRTYFS